MIDFGKYTWTILSAYSGTGFLIITLIIQTVLKSRKVRKELLLIEQEKSSDTKDD
ncbi:MAG: heme exporter protein CcmD [Paracoccaceae bacterium]|jgi:hypothetical protein|nr:heme exporter protein CcmD [Paracoccaceae bacterium]